MIFHRNNYDDIKRYYSNTIIKLPELSGDRLWQIVHISMEEVKLVDVDGMEIYIDLYEEYKVEYPLPGRTVYQMPTGRAGLLTRKPAKQYYRGLHKENTVLTFYSAGGDLGVANWNLFTLQEFVDKPCYQNPDNINLDEGDSWALNKHMAVCKGGRVMVLNATVAVVHWEKKEISMLRSLFKPEIKAALPNWKLV